MKRAILQCKALKSRVFSVFMTALIDKVMKAFAAMELCLGYILHVMLVRANKAVKPAQFNYERC